MLLGSALLVLLSAQEGRASTSIERLSGDNRIETAVAASAHGWESADAAVVATAEDFPDALSAGSLATREAAPLLLTRAHELPGTVAAELERLGVDRITVVGGTEAVSAAVERQLGALDGDPAVDRVAGDSRYETAKAVAVAGGNSEGALLVSGEDFPDAISATALSIASDLPVVFAHPFRLLDATTSALEEIDATRVTVVGGAAAVSDEVVDSLEGRGIEVERLSGANRYATSVAVAEHVQGLREEAVRTPVFASGGDFPDALGAGVLASRLDGLLLLAAPGQPESAVDSFLRGSSGDWDDGVAVGGSAALAGDALESLGRSLRGEEHPEPEPEPQSEPQSTTPADIAVATAHEQLGKPYRFGGSGPDSFDCSGLTSYVWKAAGVDLPRVSREQFAQLPQVSRADAEPGDIVAFGSPVHHVGIYIGGGEMIEASRSGIPVRTASVHRSDLRGFVRPAR